MFNNQYCLTQAVLNGSKTMTRRIVPQHILQKVEEFQDEYYNGALATISDEDAILSIATYEYRNRFPQVGETVAIAQSYKDCSKETLKPRFIGEVYPPYNLYDDTAGWNNKMFTKAELMPHHIRITNIRIERLQDISEEDCIHEGIKEDWSGFIVGNTTYKDIRCAYSALIDKVSGKGTWNRNPWVFVYEFELID